MSTFDRLFNVAVIGIGNMGGNHIRTYLEIEGIKLVGISDINEQLCRTYSEKYGVPYFLDFRDMLEKEEIDIVSIVVPSKLHHRIAMECINRGIHILLEKPITLDVKEGEELIKKAKEKNINLLVGHIERFNPAVRKVKELIEKGEIGEITAITAKRIGGLPPQIRDANIVIDLGIHDIDISNYLVGSLPEEVLIHKKSNHLVEREDSAEIFMKYRGVSSYIQTNWISPVKLRKLTITGSNGYLEMDYISQKIELYKSNYEKFKEKNTGYNDYILKFSDPDKVEISIGKKEPLKEEILFLINSIRNNEQISSEFALDALKIALNN